MSDRCFIHGQLTPCGDCASIREFVAKNPEYVKKHWFNPPIAETRELVSRDFPDGSFQFGWKNLDGSIEAFEKHSPLRDQSGFPL